jgi:hypothetical protein
MLDDNKAQMEMDLIMNEQKDPVSGNTAPIGAKPSEVRDDIDIRVSEGEYVVNAQTVRYFGEEFFNELQEAAAQGFKRIKEGDELPFRDDELDVDETEDQEVEPEGFAYGGAVKGYAEGDKVVPEPVGGGYGGYGGTGPIFSGFQSKTFINEETGQKIVIFFFNGRPMSKIPEGFREMGATPAEEQARATQAPRDDDDDKPKQEPDPTWRNTPVDDWSMDDFKNYASDMKMQDTRTGILAAPSGKLNILEKGIIGLVGGAIGGVPGALALGKLAEKAKIDQAKQVSDKMNILLSTGKNLDGSSLTEQDNNDIFKIQYEANVVSANIDPTGQTTGTPIYEQPFYQQDDDNGGTYTGPDGKEYDSFHDYVVTSGSSASTLNIDALMPPTADFDSIEITPEEQAAADKIMAGTATQEDRDTLSGDDKKDDKILCDLIYRYGYLDEDIWRLDEAFGDRVALEDPELLEGYHTWAKPMVAWIEKETFLSNLYLKYWCVPFTRRWAINLTM